jgi:hypothetical protein
MAGTDQRDAGVRWKFFIGLLVFGVCRPSIITEL